MRTQRKEHFRVGRIFIWFHFLRTKEISYEWNVQAHKILCVWDWKVSHQCTHQLGDLVQWVGKWCRKTCSLPYASGKLVSQMCLIFKPESSVLIQKHTINVKGSFVPKGLVLNENMVLKSCKSIFGKIFMWWNWNKMSDISGAWSLLMNAFEKKKWELLWSLRFMNLNSLCRLG